MALFDHREASAFNPKYKHSSTIGVVSDRRIHKTRGAQVRVTNPATGKTSGWMCVEQEGTYGKQHFFCPRKGERVRVNRMANGLESGTVGKPFYCKAVPSLDPPPPHIDADVVRYDDGSEISYNPDKNTYSISLQKGGILNITSPGPVTISAGSVTIKAGQITLDGPVSITQDLSVQGNINGSSDENISGNTYSGSRTGGPI